MEVYPYTKETALLAGKIDGEQQSLGIIIPFGDLLIGATALFGYSLMGIGDLLSITGVIRFSNPEDQAHGCRQQGMSRLR